MNTDLWTTMARLAKRPILLIIIVLATVTAAGVGWAFTSPSYSATASQAIIVRAKDGGAAPNVGAYELGVIATILTSNANSAVGGEGGTFTATNAVVNPPAMLPLITLTATGTDAEMAQGTITRAKQANADLLKKLQESPGNAGNLTLVDVDAGKVVVSQQPRLRSASAAGLAVFLLGLIATFAVDTYLRRQHAKRVQTAA